MVQRCQSDGVAKVLRNYRKEPAVLRKKILKIILDESGFETARL